MMIEWFMTSDAEECHLMPLVVEARDENNDARAFQGNTRDCCTECRSWTCLCAVVFAKLTIYVGNVRCLAVDAF